VFEGCYCLDSRYLRETQKKHLEWRDTQRRAIGIEPEDPVALFVGRMVAERDIPCLMAGFRSAVMSFPRAKLVIVGDGPYRSWATEFCRNQGLSDSVRFLNPVPYEDLMSVYAAADIYVQPSSREPYSLSTAQAAVMGLPVVSSDAVGAVDDYVVDGATGLVFHSGDAQAMADALCSLLGQPSVAAEMGESACAVASERSAEWAARQFILAALAAGERRLAGFS
jgi:glycosyltransferase involved in cell wall biosynthesis